MQQFRVGEGDSTALPLPLEGRGWTNSERILDVILESEKARFLFSSSSIYLLIFWLPHRNPRGSRLLSAQPWELLSENYVNPESVVCVTEAFQQ